MPVRRGSLRRRRRRATGRHDPVRRIVRDRIRPARRGDADRRIDAGQMRHPNDRCTVARSFGSGALHVRADALRADSSIGRIARMVAEAQTAKASVQRYADVVAGWFVPAVFARRARDAARVGCPPAAGARTRRRDRRARRRMPVRARSGDARSDRRRHWPRRRARRDRKGGPVLERACCVTTVVAGQDRDADDRRSAASTASPRTHGTRVRQMRCSRSSRAPSTSPSTRSPPRSGARPRLVGSSPSTPREATLRSVPE